MHDMLLCGYVQCIICVCMLIEPNLNRTRPLGRIACTRDHGAAQVRVRPTSPLRIRIPIRWVLILITCKPHTHTNPRTHTLSLDSEPRQPNIPFIEAFWI
ncbi:hypothetical protein Hanom_Chr07g00623031 [Helianthus anomalus]